MEKKDKIGYHIGRKAEMTNTKSYRNQWKSYHIEASQLIYLANQFTGPV